MPNTVLLDWPEDTEADTVQDFAAEPKDIHVIDMRYDVIHITYGHIM